MGKRSRMKKLGRLMRPAAQNLVAQVLSNMTPAIVTEKLPQEASPAQPPVTNPGANIPIVVDKEDIRQMKDVARRKLSNLWTPNRNLLVARKRP